MAQTHAALLAIVAIGLGIVLATLAFLGADDVRCTEIVNDRQQSQFVCDPKKGNLALAGTVGGVLLGVGAAGAWSAGRPTPGASGEAAASEKP